MPGVRLPESDINSLMLNTLCPGICPTLNTINIPLTGRNLKQKNHLASLPKHQQKSKITKLQELYSWSNKRRISPMEKKPESSSKAGGGGKES